MSSSFGHSALNKAGKVQWHVHWHVQFSTGPDSENLSKGTNTYYTNLYDVIELSVANE